MNKKARKEVLREIFYLLQNTSNKENIELAKTKVTEMLAGHGLFMITGNSKVSEN